MMKLASGLIRWWVCLYTAGLPREVRDARRAEIESDLWEQGEDGAANGSRRGETALQSLVRLLLGVPADLSWRLEQGLRRRAYKRVGISPGKGNATRTGAGWSFIVIALLVAAFWLVAGALNAFGSGESTAREDFGRFWAGMIFFLPAAMIVAGLWLQRRSPLLGSALVLVGVVPMAIVMYWTVLVPVAAAVLVLLAGARAIKLARERDHFASA